MNPPTSERRILDPMTLLGLSTAMTTALSTGLLNAAATPRTPAEYARELNLHEGAVTHVLSVLAVCGVLERTGERYGFPADVPESGMQGAMMLAILQHQFQHLPEFLRTGQPLAFMDDSLEQREASYSGMVSGMIKAFAGAAAALATQLDLRPAQVLDVGCGAGVWSLEIARRVPDAHVTGQDLPAVLEAFKAHAATLQLGARTATLPGDMFSVALPAAHYDLVVVANVLRLESSARARELLRRLAPALRPGGHLLVVDALAHGTPRKDLIRVVYGMHLALRTQVGGVHTPAEIAGWMGELGMSGVREVDCGTHPGAIGAILGRRD